MAETYDQLLSSLGFGAADAALEQGQIARKVELGKSMQAISYDDQRRGLAADLEGRGVTSSGEANLGYARLEANNANQLAAIDIGAADSLIALQRRVQQQKANQEANDRAFALQQEMANRQYELQKQQAQDANTWNQRMFEAQSAASQGPSLDQVLAWLNSQPGGAGDRGWG